MTLIEQIEFIDKQIIELQENRSILAKQLAESAYTFEEKLQAWVNCNEKINGRYYMIGYELPNIVKYCKKNEIDKNSTIFLEGEFEEEIGTILDNIIDQYMDWKTPDSKYYISQEIISCLEEAIKNNLGSFTFDY